MIDNQQIIRFFGSLHIRLCRFSYKQCKYYFLRQLFFEIIFILIINALGLKYVQLQKQAFKLIAHYSFSQSSASSVISEAEFIAFFA
jgi:hypothetical protein